MPPTHELIDEYLDTLGRLARLDVDTELSGHWPSLDRSGFAGLVRDSRECVFRDLAFLLSTLRSKSFRFAELLQALNDPFRAWPESADIHYHYALSGYMSYLERRGELSMEQNIVRGI